MALYFEDFTPGREFETAERTLTAADIAAFAELSGDHNPLHLDAEFARTTPFGTPIAHGALGLALATGLLSQTGLTRETLVALTGITWRFRAPIRSGDTIRVRLRVSDQRRLAAEDRGLVRFAASVVNQAGEVVQEGEIIELIKRR